MTSSNNFALSREFTKKLSKTTDKNVDCVFVKPRIFALTLGSEKPTEKNLVS